MKITSILVRLLRLQGSRISAKISFLWCLPLFITAQTPAPGGVAGPKLWYTTEISPAGELSWKNQLNGQLSHPQSVSGHPKEQYYLNFNPAYSFETAIPGIELSIPQLKQEKWTLFTLYQTRDTFTEKSIWSFAQAERTREILTTRRLADLQRFEYLNFPQQAQTAPQISTYLHHESPGESGPADQMILLLGRPPQDRQLPVTTFAGKLPELILYERVLAPEERQRVESYLAIKYGTNLDLSLQHDYLDAEGRVLYAPARSGDYIHHLTGIGRDDRSGLYQKQSSSSYETGLITISLGNLADNNITNTATIANRHFLLWADNKQPLDWGEKQALQPQSIQRQWQVSTTGSWAQTATELQFDTKRLRSPIAPGETYWLIIDRSGQGTFTGTEHLDYYPLSQLTPSGKATFRNIIWDPDGSGTDVFTVAKGPELMVRTRMDLPTCFPEQTGSLQLQPLGGRPPYRFQLRNDQEGFTQWTLEDNTSRNLADLPPGTYELLLTDADGREYRETFFFQSDDAPTINLVQRYQLTPDGPLRLDAGSGSTSYRQYQWQSPDGQVTQDPVLEITQAGTYQLQIDHQGCIARQTIIVAPAPKGNFRRVELFPNPSSDGQFQLRIHLEKPADLQLKVFDPGGRLLLEQRQSGSDYYHTGEQLSGKGTYLLQLSSQNDQITLPLIVQ